MLETRACAITRVSGHRRTHLLYQSEPISLTEKFEFKSIILWNLCKNDETF